MRGFVAGAVTGAAIGICGAAHAGYLWPWQIEATGRGGKVEPWLMRQLFDRAVRRQAPRVANPFAVSIENLDAGLKVFRDGARSPCL